MATRKISGRFDRFDIHYTAVIFTVMITCLHLICIFILEDYDHIWSCIRNIGCYQCHTEKRNKGEL